MSVLWGGRFTKKEHELMKKFNESFSLDKRLWREDITASIAHVTMLGKCNIITLEESEILQKSLKELYKEIEKDNSLLTGDYEDIHSFVEAKIIEKCGVVGKKMHTARSRNDQVATDMKMYVKNSMKILLKSVKELVENFSEKAKNTQDLIPAYTHLQRAQIVPFSAILLSYVAMFKRDIKKIENAIELLDENPLGACALAGTTYNIDREITTKLLNFSKIQENPLDCVSDRDFIMDSIYAMTSLMLHMSRFSEDFIIYSTKEFDFIELPDEFTTGSSIMPQKKNPDALELIRGKSAKIMSLLQAILATIKGLPLSYNKDLQEDKAIYFEAFDTTLACSEILKELITLIKLNKKRLKDTIQDGFLNATEFADYLVQKGLAFREAHEVVGKIVLKAIEKNKQLQDFSIEELKLYSEVIDEEIYSFLQPENIMKKGTKKDLFKNDFS